MTSESAPGSAPDAKPASSPTSSAAAASPAAETVDVLVVGSGAGGLSAAVTAAHRGLSVLVVEKEPVFGGTTARSGGWLWIPCNGPSAREGIQDTLEAARTYLQHEAGNHFDPARVDAFLENGPKMVDFFEAETDVAFVTGTAFSDYHPTAPGGSDGGRSICAAPYDGRQLGDEVKRLRPPLKEITFLGMMIGSGKELLHFFNVTKSLTSAAFVGRRLVSHAVDVATKGRSMRLTNGNALAGRLAKSAFDRGVRLWTSAPAVDLVRDADGAVTGAVIEREGKRVTIAARRGVVLASGGFPQDLERRKRLFPHAPSGAEHHSPAPAGNTGDGLRLAETAGAALDESLPNAAAWVPVSKVPWPDGSVGVFPHFIDRAKPGVIAVAPNGKRFVNEGNSYHDFVQALVTACAGEPGEARGWLIIDHRAIRKYGLGFAKPFPLPLTPYLNSGYLKRGRSLVELARAIGVDPETFERTVTRFNTFGPGGDDPDFAKGSTAYNRFQGDPEIQPNPCVHPLNTPPFYAVEVVVGDLGTFAGIRTDANAQALGADGRPIPGLYAVGNDNASIMGGNYPGGGITLGPAMTFGYIIGNHLAETG
ncbi:MULTISPECIES: FAD-dependent oxidoreductase [Thalassobaculum]|uniref:Succinate dehydrogenase/fumarate reductase, flavoprotein subunit n=1 Tax=Thalassobaculum litoreum DSM 18839 TaxID=1123362 RepID=A0A8G2EX61_9PROT|nr:MULTISPECIES: FAD-dependent oxidoreductase [Thalassobaculum]SDG08580.1 Succinate dehydrogenase/fumarate reductase, flavoprotein subunit [Thalassobaculum litoreum DSM 18839]